MAVCVSLPLWLWSTMTCWLTGASRHRGRREGAPRTAFPMGLCTSACTDGRWDETQPPLVKPWFGATISHTHTHTHTHTRVLASQQNKPYQPWVCGQIWELFCMKRKASTWDFAGTKAERSQVRCRSCFSKYAEEKQGFNAPCKDTPMIT